MPTLLNSGQRRALPTSPFISRDEGEVESLAQSMQNPICDASLSDQERVRLLALRILTNPNPDLYLWLRQVHSSQWRQLAPWLDCSGLALYFFDCLQKLDWHNALPNDLSARLEENLVDNAARTQGFMNESIAIQDQFQNFCVRYAVLKGVSLWPNSVPALKLRSQLDLDFLVGEESITTAQKVLEARGYRLYAVSGRSWEFKRNEKAGVTLKDLYKDQPSKAVELHIAHGGNNDCPLDRTEWRSIAGFEMPVLSPVDLFLGQGLHVYKHVCSEFMRIAHLFEFHKHLLFRLDDDAFWRELEGVAKRTGSAGVRLGVAILIVSEMTAACVPESLARWTVDTVPPLARQWVKTYGRRFILSSFPGSKRYLLLQRALYDAGVARQRADFRAILPTRLPPMMVRALPNETTFHRIVRNWAQLKFLVHRLRFHITAGFDLYRESRRWRRLANRTSL